MNILVVDDLPENRLLLKRMLQKKGHQVILAENGQQSLQLCQQEAPDLVLMDIMMPVMNGIEAIKIIRGEITDRWLPIIVVSALSDEQNVVQGLEAGADDYLSKPINIKILEAKIQAIQRTLSLQDKFFENQQTLQRYHQQNEQELEFAKNIFEKILAQNNLQDSQIDFWIKPSKRFSGDYISTKRMDDDKLYFMLADSTGHGLAAALPTIIVHQVFQAMSAKQQTVSAIVREINRRLKQDIPVGHFVALALGYLDAANNQIELWNGGLPPLIMRHESQEIDLSLSSKHLFCGVLNDEEFDDTCDVFTLPKNSELFLYSDGLTDAVDSVGDFFGEKKLMDIVGRAEPKQSVNNIRDAITQHIDPNQEQDDISCLVVYSA